MKKLEAALEREAFALARTLQKKQVQLVLAESCTAGMVAAALGRVPGISKHLCGSAVVYQSETKHAWLKIPQRLIECEGTESLRMSQALASQALKRTPLATVSAAITGDLGPTGNIGTIFMACEIRRPFSLQVSEQVELLSMRGSHQKMRRGKTQRHALQLLASQCLLRMVRQLLSDTLR